MADEPARPASADDDHREVEGGRGAGTWAGGWLVPLVTLLLVGAILACVLRMGAAGAGAPVAADLEDDIRTGRYQAVILDNERVYFGKLRPREGNWFELEDAFFIREEAGEGGKSSQKVVPVQQELAQPDGDLLINADNIVVVENLSSNSAVAEAIDDVRE